VDGDLRGRAIDAEVGVVFRGTKRTGAARVLLLGGRAPATLELARSFASAGHRVFVAESMRAHLLRGSTAVTRNYRVPAPRADHDAGAFAEGLRDVVRKEAIDLIVPTCEEVFHVAKRLDVLAPQTRVLAMPLDELARLHSKATFIEGCALGGERVPETERFTSVEGIEAQVRDRGPELVLKPEFSRFAGEVVISPERTMNLAALGEVSEARPWVVQRRLHGRAVCSFSVAHAGRLTLHSAYAMEATAGRGAAILFRPLEHPRVRDWVTRFVERESFTGQVAFDFIDVDGEGPYAIECNPRATSGVHLFRDDPRMARAYLDPTAPCVEPHADRVAMLLLPLLVYGGPALGARELLSTIWRGRDVALSWRDPAAAWVQAATAGELLRRALVYRVTPLQASTLDIEWNGPRDRAADWP